MRRLAIAAAAFAALAAVPVLAQSQPCGPDCWRAYLPAVSRAPTLTRTPTATPSPTATPVPVTPRPTPVDPVDGLIRTIGDRGLYVGHAEPFGKETYAGLIDVSCVIWAMRWSLAGTGWALVWCPLASDTDDALGMLDLLFMLDGEARTAWIRQEGRYGMMFVFDADHRLPPLGAAEAGAYHAALRAHAADWP